MRLSWLAPDEAPGTYITIQYRFNKTKQHTQVEKVEKLLITREQNRLKIRGEKYGKFRLAATASRMMENAEHRGSLVPYLPKALDYPGVLQAVLVKILTEILFWQCAFGRKPSTTS